MRFLYSFVAAAIGVVSLASPGRAIAAGALTGKMDIFDYSNRHLDLRRERSGNGIAPRHKR